MDHLRQRYLTVPIEENLSVNEQMVPFKGRSCLRQYNPKKPHKWGYKIWVLCGASGYAYDFECYTGGADNKLLANEDDCGASGNVVVRLSRSIPEHVKHKLYFDNYFTSPDLQLYLAKKGILSLGTVRANRIPQCSLKNDTELKKLGRGSVDEVVATVDEVDISSVRWFDNKTVTFLSTFAGSQPMSEVTRWNGKTGQYEKVACPSVVSVYNKHMGGVDLIDSLIGLYRCKIRSKKWYHRLFFHLLDMTVVNAWLLYRRHESSDRSAKTMSLLQFKSSVAEALCRTGPTSAMKRGRPSMNSVDTAPQPCSTRHPVNPVPVDDVRYDGFEHFPKLTVKRGRCRREGCSGQSRIVCTKCGVHLCLIGAQDCFAKFHTK